MHPVILSEVVGGGERRISDYVKHGPGHDLRILRFFAHTLPVTSLRMTEGIVRVLFPNHDAPETRASLALLLTSCLLAGNVFGTPGEQPDPAPGGHDDHTEEMKRKDLRGRRRPPRTS